MAIELYGITNKTPIKSSNRTINDSGIRSIQRDQSKPASAADTVNLTQIAQQLKEAEKALASAPIVDVSRVEEIAHALDQGDYTVDAEHTAEKIIELEQQLAS